MNQFNSLNAMQISGLGAGMDSFYEYLLKSYVLFEEKSDLQKFLDVYKAIKSFMRRGRRHCNQGYGPHPHYVNVNMESGDTFTQWIDSLQAAMPGLQVIYFIYPYTCKKKLCIFLVGYLSRNKSYFFVPVGSAW